MFDVVSSIPSSALYNPQGGGNDERRQTLAATVAFKAVLDSITYKAVAERELRKRVGFQLKNEGKALQEMREMRKEDR